MQYLGWVGQSVVFLMTKIQNARVGDVEVKKTNFQHFLESQRKHHHPPNISTSMFYFDLLFLGETITDIARKLISDTGVVTLARFPTGRAVIMGIAWIVEVTAFR